MAPLGDDDDMTALVDADLPIMALVDKGANGVPRFLIAKQAEDASGLLDAAYVRELIGKQADEPTARERVQMPSGVTLTGSPADIAAFIHKAAQRADEDEPGDVAKAEMSGKSQNDLPDSAFAYIEDGGKKDADGKTTPRSLRHFPVHDAAHARNALARAPQSPLGDKAMPKIRAAAKRFGIEVSKEAGVPDTVTKDMSGLDGSTSGMDPAVPLAEPDGDYAGSPAEPGSPAWEAIDAATACKWTSMLARTRAAVSLLADREMMEAASGDEDDAGNAMDLQDACCAIDFAISVLAPFAVAEQSEADCGDMDAMAMVGKSAADLEAAAAVAKAMESADLADPLAKIEGLTWIRKSGRVLSSVNEAHIREAAGRLNTVLSSLPSAPTADDGQPVAKEQETTVADETSVSGASSYGGGGGGGGVGAVTLNGGTSVAAGGGGGGTVAKAAGDSPEAQAKDTGPVNAGGTTGMGQPRVTGPSEALPGDGPQAALPGDAQVPGRQVIKADGEGKTPMCVVYDQKGRLIGIVAPDDITPVANSEAEPEDDMDPDGDGTAAAAPAADAADMTPQPAGEAGTPAGAVPDDGVAKAGQHTITLTQDVLKSAITDALAQLLAAQAPAEDVAKQADVAGLLDEVATLKARLATVEEQPATPRVFTNGQVPPAHQLRGQDQGTAPGQVDVAKALDLKHEMYTADPKRAKEIHDDMSELARAQLAAIHRR